MQQKFMPTPIWGVSYWPCQALKLPVTRKKQSACLIHWLPILWPLYCLTPLVWAGSARSFRAVLAEFSTFFELDSFQFSAYSIRRGGASFAFAQGASLDELLIKGRWQSQRTAPLYLDTGRAALIQTRQVKYLHHYGSKLKGFCEQLRRRRTS